MRPWITGLLLVGLAQQVSAQRGQLSLGLSTTYYYPTGYAGLGGAVDYRWRVGAHLEVMGQLNAMHFWRVYSKDERYGSSNGQANLFFGGLGLGYFTKPNGFHIGLLVGGVGYNETVNNHTAGPEYMTGLALTLGGGISKRIDLSLDTWGLRTMDEKEAINVLPLIRLSYRLFGKN